MYMHMHVRATQRLVRGYHLVQCQAYSGRLRLGAQYRSIEAAVRNGGQALRSIVRVQKWHSTQTICRYLSSAMDEEHKTAWKQCLVSN